jgi:hypothetical protein
MARRIDLFTILCPVSKLFGCESQNLLVSGVLGETVPVESGYANQSTVSRPSSLRRSNDRLPAFLAQTPFGFDSFRVRHCRFPSFAP